MVNREITVFSKEWIVLQFWISSFEIFFHLVLNLLLAFAVQRLTYILLLTLSLCCVYLLHCILKTEEWWIIQHVHDIDVYCVHTSLGLSKCFANILFVRKQLFSKSKLNVWTLTEISGHVKITYAELSWSKQSDKWFCSYIIFIYVWNFFCIFM